MKKKKKKMKKHMGEMFWKPLCRIKFSIQPSLLRLGATWWWLSIWQVWTEICRWNNWGSTSGALLPAIAPLPSPVPQKMRTLIHLLIKNWGWGNNRSPLSIALAPRVGIVVTLKLACFHCHKVPSLFFQICWQRQQVLPGQILQERK